MTKWIIDNAHSEIGFKVKHLMISTVRGKFTKFDGSIDMPDEDFTKAEISFSADAASINTENEGRDNHLRSADFFDSANFSSLFFKSKSIVKKNDNSFAVTGDFTMHGVTKDVVLDATLNGTAVGMDKNRVMSFDISGSLSRKDFGLLWNAPTETGGVVVSDKVKLDITAEFKEVK